MIWTTKRYIIQTMNRQIVSVTLNKDKNGNKLVVYPFERKQIINKLN